MPFNIPSLNAALSGGIGNGITHCGLMTLSDPGTGTDANAVEVTGGGPAYARKAVTWAAAAAGSRANGTSSLVFDVPAATTVGFVSFWNAVSGNTNNYLGYGGLNQTVKGFGSVDSTDVTNNTITSVAHGLANDQRLIVYNVLAEGMATGLTEGTIYFVVGVATDTFQVATTLGGAAIDITGKAELYFLNLFPEIFAAQGTLTLAIGAIVLDAVVI